MLLIDPSESLPLEPLSVVELVGRVIVRLLPALAVGAVLGALVTVTETDLTPLDTPEFQHSRLYMFIPLAGLTGSLPPLNDFQPDQAPVAKQESAVPPTVQVRVDESPEVIVLGLLVRDKVGATIGAALTATSISSVSVAPSLSVTVRRKR
jgi:hypothetical protein